MNENEFLTLFGPNGAGKTTLIKILATLYTPTTGEALIDGLSTTAKSTLARKKIGMISHEPLLYLDLTAYENLRFYGSMYQVRKLDERIDELLEQVELYHRRYDLIRTFSQGMKQRIAIARALLHKPEILFLDEPHSGLDPHAQEILDELLKSIRENHTFVMITHNIERGLGPATRAMILDDGQIIYHQPKKDLNIAHFEQIYREKVESRL